jgi:uncharacterized protein YndB with AHSA1/START domain
MNKITVTTIVTSDIETVWNCWTNPEHVTKWNFASDDWECVRAGNDLEVGKNFSYTMAAKDGSISFDFAGTYTTIVPQECIEYAMEDGRMVRVEFKVVEGGVEVTETFDPENENPIEMQQEGWQTIFNNFKKHVESQN